jgi:hypothetical protein
MSSPVSVETVRALFRLHGFSTSELFRNPVANVVMQELIDAGYLCDQQHTALTRQKSLNEARVLQRYVVEKYGRELKDSELFATLEMIDTLSFLIDDQDGLNLPIGPVLEFFKRYLHITAGLDPKAQF